MEGNVQQIGYVIDNDGVIMQSLYDGDTIRRKSQMDYLTKHTTNFNESEAFVKVYINPVIALYKDLSTKEFAVAMSLMPFISYEDGILRYDGKIVDLKQICSILDENYVTYRRAMATLINKEVVRKIKVPSDVYQDKTKQCYVVNPYIFLRGRDIYTNIAELFENSKWAMLDKE